MFIYNTTIKVDIGVAYEWLKWQKEFYIPRMLDTGLFYDFRIYELLDQDETEGKTFVVQYFAVNRSNYDNYILHHATDFYNHMIENWGDRFIEFATLLKTVQ
jgi:hypothetical protein